MNIIVAVPVDEELATFIGKRGSANSIVFYNRKLGSDVIIALFPSQEEDKAYALAESVLLASQVVISTKNVDKRFGEALIAGSLLNKKILLTDQNGVVGMLNGAGITNFEIVTRENLLDKIREGAGTQGEEAVRVDIDKAFPVKGVGTIALGVVTRGVIKQHDKLYHTSGKEVLVRSLQSQDEDIVSAEKGTRVGISLKEISDEEIRKGDLLTAKAVSRKKSLTIAYRVSSIVKEMPAVGNRYGLASNFAYSECDVKSLSEREMKLELAAPMPVEIGDEVLLTRKDVPRIFASGRVKDAG